MGGTDNTLVRKPDSPDLSYVSLARQPRLELYMPEGMRGQHEGAH